MQLILKNQAAIFKNPGKTSIQNSLIRGHYICAFMVNENCSKIKLEKYFTKVNNF